MGKQILSKKLCCIFLIIVILAHLTMTDRFNYTVGGETTNATCPNCIIEDPVVVLDTFPVDLDDLFWIDNLTKQAEVLNYIGNGSITWPITPWGAHYISNHNEGVDHWYLNSYQLAHIVAPHDGIATAERGNLGSNVIMQNGSEMIEDNFLVIDIGNNCYIYYDHLNLFKTIYDEIMINGSYTFFEGEHIGYSMDAHNGGVDFGYEVNGRMICPLHAYNPTLQTKITDYYEMQIPKAKIAGLFPQVDICNNVSIAIENTVWGVWNYSTGFLDSYHHSDPWYEGKVITFFNRSSFANPDTFYRDWKDRWNKNITDDIIGIFSDNRGNEIPEYNTTDNSYLRFVEGDFVDGILEIILNTYDGEWGGLNDSIYVRYAVEFNEAGYKDDSLTVEFYSSLVEAQAGFTDKNLTYVRYFHWWNRERIEHTHESNLQFYLPFLIVIGIAIFTKKKKKKMINFRGSLPQ